MSGAGRLDRIVRQFLACQSTRSWDEPRADEPHHHVWRNHEKAQAITIPGPEPTGGRRSAALRAGILLGQLAVCHCEGDLCQATLRAK